MDAKNIPFVADFLTKLPSGITVESKSQVNDSVTWDNGKTIGCDDD